MSMLISPWLMPLVLPRTNSTDPKALDSFSCAAAYRSSRSCSVAHTRTSDDPERKMSPQLWEWQPPQNGHYVTARANKSVKKDCEMNFGREFQRTCRRRNRTVRTRCGWQTR